MRRAGRRPPRRRRCADGVLPLKLRGQHDARLRSHSRRRGGKLARRIGPDFGRTELYLTHFFGIERALEFLRLLEQHPDRVAAELFPNAAQSNPGVFEPIEGSRMTLREVYDFFAAKFDTGRYETLNPALALVQENWQ